MIGLLERIRRTALFERLKAAESPRAATAWFRFQSGLHFATRGHLVRRRAVTRYLATTVEPRLQIGAGPNRLDGWLNSDVALGEVHVALQRRLPFEDSTFSYVFGEHVLEHLSEASGIRLLAELHRILRPSGVVRLVTPDLAKLVAIYEDRNPAVDREAYVRYIDRVTGQRRERPGQAFNTLMRCWGHRYIYDEEDLTAKLRQAGFGGIAVRDPGESPHVALRGLERHGPEWANRAEAICIEATAGG